MKIHMYEFCVVSYYGYQRPSYIEVAYENMYDCLYSSDRATRLIEVAYTDVSFCCILDMPPRRKEGSRQNPCMIS